MRLAMIHAVTGLHSIQSKIDQLADQMANVDTVGYKRKDPSFSDVLNSRLHGLQAVQFPGRETPPGMSLGHGAHLVNNQTVWTQGSVKQTDVPTDLMIAGGGVFELAADDTGARRFTRGGSFQLAPLEGGMRRLVTSEGLPLLDVNGNPIDLPENTEMRVDEEGNVYARGEDGAEVFVATLRYVHVLNPQQLERVGVNVYRIAEVGGERPDDVVLNTDLNDNPLGEIRQGALEMANVDLGWTMSELMTALRSYQLNARALDSVDAMSGIVNNIRS